MAFKIEAMIYCDGCYEELAGHEVWIEKSYTATVEELTELARAFGWERVNNDLCCTDCLDKLEKQTAIDRARDLMAMPTESVPPLALRFAQRMYDTSGFTHDAITFTAFAKYAQCVEGLPCSVPKHKAQQMDFRWFEKQATT